MVKRPRLKVVKRAGRRHLVLRWTDPATRKLRERSSGTSRRREAERQAAALEEQLAKGKGDGSILWWTFCDLYAEQKLPETSKKNRANWQTVCNWVNDTIAPNCLADIDQSSIADLKAAWQKAGLAGASIASYLTSLRAAVNWAKDEKALIAEVPKFQMPKKAKGRSKLMRSRPINGEEFERIIMNVEKERPNDPWQWARFLRGLWESGLRVGELATLSWDSSADLSLCTMLEYPSIRMFAEGHKRGEDLYQPITPQFWKLCCEESERKGLAFPIVINDRPASTETIARVIGDIGDTAGVITGERKPRPNGRNRKGEKPKYKRRKRPENKKMATSHDIGRRAFATRMGQFLSQPELAEWLRHKTPDTTMQYYYEQDVQALSRRVWGDESGDT